LVSTDDWLERVRDEQVRRLYAEDNRVALASMAVAIAAAALFHLHQPDGSALAWVRPWLWCSLRGWRSWPRGAGTSHRVPMRGVRAAST